MIRLQDFHAHRVISQAQEVPVVHLVDCTSQGIDILPEVVVRVELRRTVLSESGCQHLVGISGKISSLTLKEGVDLSGECHRTVGDWIRDLSKLSCYVDLVGFGGERKAGMQLYFATGIGEQEAEELCCRRIDGLTNRFYYAKVEAGNV